MNVRYHAHQNIFVRGEITSIGLRADDVNPIYTINVDGNYIDVDPSFILKKDDIKQPSLPCSKCIKKDVCKYRDKLEEQASVLETRTDFCTEVTCVHFKE